MTVRMTQAKSGSTRPSADPYAALRTDRHEPEPATGIDPPPDSLSGTPPTADDGETAHAALAEEALEDSPAPEHPSRPDGRRAQRAARHQRRNISVACAVLIAVCLVITILIVGMARNRSPGVQVVVPASAFALPGQASRPVLPAVNLIEIRAVTAPKGGHP
jgi:hypothetical protein